MVMLFVVVKLHGKKDKSTLTITIFVLPNKTTFENARTSSWVNLLKPNLFVHIDSASSAAGSTRFLTFKEPRSLSMQENKDWK